MREEERKGEEQEQEERREVTKNDQKSKNIWVKRQKNSPDRQKCKN